MTKTQLDRTLDTLVDFADINRQALTRLTESMETGNRELNASIDRLGDRIDQMGDRIERGIDKLGGKIDDLAAQNSILSDNITRLERTVNSLAADTREQHAIARSQSENVAQLVALAQQQAQTVDRMLAVRG